MLLTLLRSALVTVLIIIASVFGCQMVYAVWEITEPDEDDKHYIKATVTIEGEADVALITVVLRITEDGDIYQTGSAQVLSNKTFTSSLSPPGSWPVGTLEAEVHYMGVERDDQPFPTFE
jgi:hypothetical protein